MEPRVNIDEEKVLLVGLKTQTTDEEAFLYRMEELVCACKNSWRQGSD